MRPIAGRRSYVDARIVCIPRDANNDIVIEAEDHRAVDDLQDTGLTCFQVRCFLAHNFHFKAAHGVGGQLKSFLARTVDFDRPYVGIGYGLFECKALSRVICTVGARPARLGQLNKRWRRDGIRRHVIDLGELFKVRQKDHGPQQQPQADERAKNDARGTRPSRSPDTDRRGQREQ